MNLTFILVGSVVIELKEGLILCIALITCCPSADPQEECQVSHLVQTAYASLSGAEY